MASSSSFAKENSEFDVFLSFRGETRKNFTSHLYNALEEAKVQVFIDRRLDKGKELTPTLHKVIDGAKISVVVFSSNYASSSFCLDELVKILECKESKGQAVLPIFYKIDPSDIRKQQGTYEKAFAEHEANFKGKKRCRQESSEEKMEKVQKWKSALCEASNLSGWHVDHTSDEAGTIREITVDVMNKLNHERTSRSKGQELISVPLVGESTAVANLEKIWKCLMDDKISRVGIHGMGGIGKTTIATHIYNQLREVNSFHLVFWVTVSKESSIYKLQSNIAKEIDLDLSQEKDKMKRAAKLWGALSNKKRFVLILDDMWESFASEEVGIPIWADRGKLLLTTREHRVCQRMKCERIVKVEPLLEREARDLFIRESGHQINDDQELRNIIESVIKECDGLPLAIKAIARSTIGFTKTYEWRNILQELRKPSDRQNRDMEKVFKLLKVSYDRLRNDKYRQCLHYCAMCPEDCNIIRDHLIEYCIDWGVINEIDSGQEEFDMGNTIIDELIDASLLEDRCRCVKMHDVVRDMVLTITRGTLMVKAGLQLQDFPKFTDWSANLEGVSIMANSFEGCSLNSAPNCYKLRILLIGWNEKLSELPNCFFVHMQNLTILHMGGLNSLKLLPDSISKLEALRMLYLDGCSSLEYIPSLAALKDLRHLNLSRTNVQHLPEGMKKLVNLRFLRIIDVKALRGLIPGEVLKEISLLRSLNLEGSNVEVELEALRNLKKLETLGVDFENFDALNLYLESRHWQRLRSYTITVKEHFDNREILYDRTLFWCKDRDWDSARRNGGSSDFVIPFNVEQLKLMNWDCPLDGALTKEGFSNLKHLTLKKCKLQYLISVALAKQLLQNLENLEVTECGYIEQIIGTEVSLNQTNHKNYPTIELPKLLSLCLKNLPRLSSIYEGNMELPSLEYLEIDESNKLERLPFCELPVDIYLYGSNIDSKLWWDSLQWDDQNHKQVFQNFFSESRDDDFVNSESETDTYSNFSYSEPERQTRFGL